VVRPAGVNSISAGTGAAAAEPLPST
jgi:hypothetical protein